MIAFQSLGPPFAGGVFDATGSYSGAFWSFVAMAAIAAGLLTFLRLPPPERSYRGRLLDEPGAIVVASLAPEGLTVAVLEEGGRSWTVEPGPAGHVTRPGLPGAASAALGALDWGARRLPSLADVVVLAGRPRRP